MHTLIPAIVTRAVAIAVAVLACLVITAPFVHAQDNAGATQDEAPRSTWGVVPSSRNGPDGRSAFEWTVDAGEELVDFVGVTNYGDTDLDLAIYASDAFTTPTGGFDLLPGGDEPVDVGSWVDFGVDTVTIASRSRVDVPFRVLVPDNATPGDHVGGIVLSFVEESVDGDNVLRRDHRVGARIYLRVDGELAPELTITDFSAEYGTEGPGTVSVSYTAHNQGNVRLSGDTVIRTALFGLGSHTHDLESLPEILPGDRLTQTAVLYGVTKQGRVELTLEITPRTPPEHPVLDIDPVVATTTLWLVPWWMYLVTALLVATLIWWLRRRRLQSASSDAPEIASEIASEATL